MKTTLLGVLAFVSAVLACSDLTGPRSRGLQVPTVINRTVGPPDVTFTIGSVPGTTVNLTTFAHDTWVTLEASGTVSFTSLPRAAGASQYYQFPGRSVDARGIFDGRISDPSSCALRLWVGGSAVNNSGFGPCLSGGLLVDTTKYVTGSTFILKRGLSPYQWSYDCDPWGTAICHTIPDGSQTVRLRPITVSLQQPKPSKRVWNFAAGQADIIFTASRTPDSLTIGGGRTPMPIAMTLWQWIGGDSTRLAITGYCAMGAFPNCEFYPRESGRMVTKGYTGGWEQTTSVTVQCLVAGEPALNDSTRDFSVREDLLNVLKTSNADSAAGAGWTGQEWDRTKSRHESGGVIWHLLDGGYMFVPYEDPTSTAVQYSLPDDAWSNAAAPVAGAVPYAAVHDHPTRADSIAYGWPGTTLLPNGVRAHWAQYPGDTLPNGALAPVAKKAREDSATWRGDKKDRDAVAHKHMPEFQITNGGLIWRLNYPQTNPPTATPFRPSGGTESQRKCAWPKKYVG